MRSPLFRLAALFALPLLAATAARADEIPLGWQDNSDNETGFILERADGAGESFVWAEIARLEADVTTYRDTDLDPGATYSYRVCAYNDRGRSGYSNIYVLPAVPNPPGNLRGMPADVAVVTLPPGARMIVAASPAPSP